MNDQKDEDFEDDQEEMVDQHYERGFSADSQYTYGSEEGYYEDELVGADGNFFIYHDEDSPYHELYLQKHGMEFMMPILFEDGMDYIECELYYASLLSQSSGGAYKKQRTLQPRRSTMRELRSTDHDGLLPVIRKQTRHQGKVRVSTINSNIALEDDSSNTGENHINKENVGHDNSNLDEKDSKQKQQQINQKEYLLPPKKSAPPIRRCSFSGMPQVEEFPPLTRSMSVRGFHEEEPRVCFEEYVQVVTIYPAEDLPDEVRAQIWMSRDEMSKCMRRAMMEDMKNENEEKSDRQRNRGEDSNDDMMVDEQLLQHEGAEDESDSESHYLEDVNIQEVDPQS